MQHVLASTNGQLAVSNLTNSFIGKNASPVSGGAIGSPAFFPPGLTALATLVHLCSHPKIKDWLQLLLLGIAATFARKASREAKGWLQRIFCITSVHLMNDESYDWLMGT